MGALLTAQRAYQSVQKEKQGGLLVRIDAKRTGNSWAKQNAVTNDIDGGYDLYHFMVYYS